MNKTPSRRRVVVGVDASQHAARAAAWAAAEAADRGLPLHIVHAVETSASEALVSPIPFEDYKKRILAESQELLAETTNQVQKDHSGLTVTTETIGDKPVKALMTAGEDAELIVVGTRGLGGFNGLLLGSVSLGLAHHARRPLAIVRGDTTADKRQDVVLGVDEDEPTDVIEVAFAAADQKASKLRLMHAWTLPYTYSGYYTADPLGVEQNREQSIKQAIALVREEYPKVDVEISMVRSDPARVLVDASFSARLVVVGARRERGPLAPGIGSVIHALIHHSHAPIIVVPLP